MKYSTKLLIANCIPILLFAIVSLSTGFMQFQTNLYNEKQGNLKSTALAALALYSSHGYGDYGRKSDGNVWRGMNFNISTETEIVDDLKKETNVDVTFFFGDKSEMTSIKNKAERRVVETNAKDFIRNHTLARGAELWCRN
ncbi:MAG: cache domain-containing protein, partial [Selenomonadaceae bacterium]|nr:cache domain-containing protein [Selenomonadaceae bacterium]